MPVIREDAIERKKPRDAHEVRAQRSTVTMKDFVEVPLLDHGPFSNAFSIDTVIDVIRGWYDTHSGA